MVAKSSGKVIFTKDPSILFIYPVGQKFRRNRSILHHFRDKYTFAFYAEIQDGRQKWWESDFSLKSPVDFSHTLWAKNFAEIALSCTVSKINALLHFTQKFKMAAKSGGKAIFAYSAYTLWVRNFIKIALSHTVSEISVFRFHVEIQDGCQVAGK